MSKNSAPCFHRIDFVVIIELPWIQKWSVLIFFNTWINYIIYFSPTWKNPTFSQANKNWIYIEIKLYFSKMVQIFKSLVQLWFMMWQCALFFWDPFKCSLFEKSNQKYTWKLILYTSNRLIGFVGLY